jgi:hypothetical protein
MRTRYDGHWWLSVSQPERSGFVAGYLDCYIYEYKGPGHFDHRGMELDRDSVTKVYEGDSSSLDRRVGDVLYQFRDRPGDVVPSKDGERWSERHGFFDGLYWTQIDAIGGQEEQLGFVEGYLSCHAERSRNRGAVFSKTPTEYRTLISQWYRFDERTGEMDAKRYDAKIADVLFKVRDGAK